MAMSDKPMEEPVTDALHGDNPANDPPSVPPPLALQAAEQPQKELQDSLSETQPTTHSGVNHDAVTQHNGKSDSEAETEILSGKEEDSNTKSKKEIKLEDAELISDANALKANSEQRANNAPSRERVPFLKRKRGSQDPHQNDLHDGHESSRLSSTVSSPVIGRQNSDAISTHSEHSESSPPADDSRQQCDPAFPTNHVKSDRPSHESNDSRVSLNGRKRRDLNTTAVTDGSARRASSSPSRKAHRAQSTQPGTPQPQTIKKRKSAPPPLIDRRSRPSEDAHDSDSSSVRSHVRPQLNAHTPSTSEAVMWRQIKNPKKNKDRTGQTRLARACAISVIEAEELLKERPEDIDTPDYAGNTPLQIASLKGKADVVKLLLTNGCKTDCKNVDNDTPLIDAVENGHLEVVKLLLDAGVDPGQRNAKGEKPIDLANPDMDDYEEIRDALETSIQRQGTKRRQSEDHTRPHNSIPRDTGTPSNTDSRPSPIHSARSPPPGDGPRRRTARSQHTNDAYLWVNPTPQRLREAAGKGDIGTASHILNMDPRADIEALIAAAQGGHDEMVNLMLAMMGPEPDPQPVRPGDDIKPGYTTPMLAAIGRGNIKVLNLFLNQRGFDPTRRLYKGMTYYELAKERQSSEWHEEYDILKDAYDHYKKHGRSSNHSSPQKVRSKRIGSPKSSPEASSSPHASRKIRKPRSAPDEDLPPEPKRGSSYQGTASKSSSESRKPSAISTESEVDAIRRKGNRMPDKARSASPGELMPTKPRRRLLSGNEIKLDQSQKRKEIALSDGIHRQKSGDSTAGRDGSHRRSSDASMSIPPSVKSSSASPRFAKEDPSKKRVRTSMSPQTGRGDMHEMKKKKRLRIDSEGKSLQKDLGRPHRAGPAPPANMISSTPVTSTPAAAPSAASAVPVAFMSSATASPVTNSPNTKSPVTDLRPEESDEVSHRSTVTHDATEMPMTPVKEGSPRIENENLAREQLRAEEATRVELVERHKIQAERESQLIKEREEEERRALLLREEEAEAQRQIHEQQRREREELEAQAKKRKEEEMQKKRAELDRKRKEEQEKRRREAEEAERLRLLKVQQEEERARRESLPNGLRRYGEISPSDARSPREIARWLPLRTIFTEDLEDECEVQARGDRWLSNVQAAPLLANMDLELSQYTAWSRRPATTVQQACLWKQLRNPMAQAYPDAFVTTTDAYNLEIENRPKFLGLNIFWIRLSDFMDIVPRHPHLLGIKLPTRDFVLRFPRIGSSVPSNGSPSDTSSRTGIRDSATSPGIKEEGASPLMNGNGHGHGSSGGGGDRSGMVNGCD